MGVKPRLRIEGMTDALHAHLVSLSVTDSVGVKNDSARLILMDPGGRLEAPPRGGEISILLGFEGAPLWPVGRFVVAQRKWRGWSPQQLIVTATGADMTGAIRAARSRTFTETTWGAMIRGVAAEHDLTPRISADIDSAPLRHLLQDRESDLHLLQRVGDENGWTVKVAGGALIVKPRLDGRTPDGGAIPDVTLTRAEVLEPEFDLIERAQVGAVAVRLRDRGAGETRTVTAETGQVGPTHELRDAYADETAAFAAAQAQAAASARERGEGSFRVKGRGDLFAERPLRLSGLRRDVDGLWKIKSVTHEYSVDGYFCDVSVSIGEGQ